MASINQLNAVDTVSGSDLLALYSQSNGDARKLALSKLAAWMATQITSNDDKVTQYSAPSSSGFTAQVNDDSASIWLILIPSAGYAAGTIKLPSFGNAIDKQEVLVNCTQAVTALTVDGNGATVTGAPTTLAANDFFRLRFDGVTSAWYRVG